MSRYKDKKREMGWGISRLDFNDPAKMPNTKNKMAGSVKLLIIVETLSQKCRVTKIFCVCSRLDRHPHIAHPGMADAGAWQVFASAQVHARLLLARPQPPGRAACQARRGPAKYPGKQGNSRSQHLVVRT
jgi:hypothetical protein